MSSTGTPARPSISPETYVAITVDLAYAYDGVSSRESVADPAGQPIEVVRDFRDDIQARVTTMLRDLSI